jgi:Protein of unknown function (DUF3047)
LKDLKTIRRNPGGFFFVWLHTCISMFLFRCPPGSLALWVCCALLVLSGCSTIPASKDAPEQAPGIDLSAQASWKPMHLPGKRKTLFTHTTHDGRQAVLATANSSVSMFRRPLHIPADELGSLKFSWKVPQLIQAADMAQRELDDSPVRLVLAFEGDRSRFSHKNRMMSELSLALTGEELPYATLMYVWCNQCQTGDVITNPRTDRIRKFAVEAGKGNVGKWLDYERDIRSDFIKAFGEEPGALTGIAFMTDTDNTQTKATAWYGPVSLKPRAASAP